MIEPLLRSQLEPLARRRRLWRLSRDLAVCWTAVAVLALLARLAVRGPGSEWALPTLGVIAGVGALAVWRRSRRWLPDFKQMARQIEQAHPELHALLLTAVEQKPDAATGKYNFLQERLIREAVAKGTQGQWQKTVSNGRLVGTQLVQVAALVFLLASLNWLRVDPKAAAAALAARTSVEVTPGDTSIERGNGLAVLARFAGPLPPEATLIIRPDLQPERRVPLVKSLNDPIFGGTITEITNSLSYRVSYQDGESRNFKVEVFEFPRLERADAHLVYPAYTELPEKRVEDTRRISAVEGSTLDLALQLNKPVSSARLIAKDKSVIPLSAATNQANAQLRQLPLKTSQIYELVLVDANGRTNKVPTQIVVDVLTNRAPELKFISPRGDQRVSPIQEVNFQAEVWDDFGLKDYGLSYTLAGGPLQTLSLGSNAPARDKRQFAHLLSLEELQAQPDQLLSYFIWADDVGPDGRIRRSASDMFYAEVRPFEEIFREGQSPPESESEESGQANEAVKLAELQKQIINATWKLQRDHRVGLSAPSDTADPVPPGPNYAKDLEVVAQSQETARQQAAEKREESENARAKALWDTVEKEMAKASDQLAKAGKSPGSLPSAVASEQAAYQALLKLASRERQVTRGRRGQGGGQQSQQQLEQLDLTQSENKYESQKQAAATKQNPEQREQQQVLNRLKELAQRQQDLNQRLKELQTALQEAKSEQEKEEARRQLKRLREEEQQMLADTDELLNRLERPENQSRLADARQQLEQTRNQIQRTSEAIEKEAVGQALSSGTRAQRQLQDLREDMRKKSATQFADEMRQMRSDARDLAEKQEKVGEELKTLAESPRKTLSDTPEAKELLDQLATQKQKMTNLLGDMTRVSQDAEASEPLLAKHLYDTLRKASQGHPDDSLQKAGELLKLSFVNEAGQFEQRARTEIQQVKQGVEKAAESVLGDEAEALRLARNELDDLARQVEKEAAQANSAARGDPASGAGQSQRTQSQAGARQQGSPTGEKPPGGEDGAEPNAGQEEAAAELAQNEPQKGNPASQGQPNDQSRPPASGQQPGRTPGQSSGQPSPEQPRQPNEQQLAQGDGNAPAAQPPGQEPGQNPGQGGNPQPGQAESQQPPRARQRASLSDQPRPGAQPTRGPGRARGDGTRQATEGGGNAQDPTDRAPLTGEGYADWSDRLRDVEELLDRPELRNEVAGVRERARAMRTEFKKNRKPPRWDLVRAQIAEPLAEVRDRVSEELARRDPKDSLVPIDRDPVPQKFSELVRRYYEKLGSSEGGAASQKN